MNKVITTIIAIAVIATAAATVVGFTVSQPAYAQLEKDPGASFFAPGEEPQIPGWDPDRAEEDAPGQLAEIPVPQPPIPQPPCDSCAAELAPGTEGLEAGIIGPELKK